MKLILYFLIHKRTQAAKVKLMVLQINIIGINYTTSLKVWRNTRLASYFQRDIPTPEVCNPYYRYNVTTPHAPLQTTK